jgi:hypothetical protein
MLPLKKHVFITGALILKFSRLFEGRINFGDNSKKKCILSMDISKHYEVDYEDALHANLSLIAKLVSLLLANPMHKNKMKNSS